MLIGNGHLTYYATSSPDIKDSILTFFSVRILKRLVYSLVDLPQHHFFRGGCLIWWVSRLFIIALDVLLHFVIVILVFICYKFEVASWCLPYGSSQSLPSKPALCGLVSVSLSEEEPFAILFLCPLSSGLSLAEVASGTTQFPRCWKFSPQI